MAGTSSEAMVGGRRVSKRRNRNSRNKQLIQYYSSANEVESDDDLLIEIFLQVPVLSLLMFKLVSPRWYNLIKSSHFFDLRSKVPKIDTPTGIIIQQRTESIQYDFAAFDTRIQRHRILSKTSFPFGSYPDRRDIEILQSCNGLLLCYINRYMLYVYNPFTNQFRMLPQTRCMRRVALINGIKMVFDLTKSPDYKVIFASVLKQDVIAVDDGVITDALVQVQIYSSKTCEWIISNKELPLSYYNGFKDGVYWNNGIYWLNMHTGLITKLNATLNLNLTSIPTPVDLRSRNNHLYTHQLFESRGSLLLARVCNEPGDFLMVFEKKNGYSEWSMKYFINIYYIIHMIPIGHWELDYHSRPISIRSIVLEEREEDSFMVIELYGKVAQYKMMLKTLREIPDVGVIRYCICDEPCRFSCFTFSASIAHI